MPETTSEKRPVTTDKDTEIINVPGPLTPVNLTDQDPDESQLPEDPPGGGQTPGEDLE
jgi:hypothetical protein